RASYGYRQSGGPSTAVPGRFSSLPSWSRRLLSTLVQGVPARGEDWTKCIRPSCALFHSVRVSLRLSKCYETHMLERYLAGQEDVQQILEDLLPLYDLQPEDYSRVINKLVNLLIATARVVEQEGNSPLAQAVIEHASLILADY